MNQYLEFKSSNDHYESDACIIWCFDARFSGLLEEFVKKETLKNVDLVKVAGGAKEIASPEAEVNRAFMLDQIKKSIALHKTKKIILMTHTECGAYGGKTDEKFYEEELIKAKSTVTAYLADIKASVPVETYFANFEGLLKTK